MNVFRYGNAIRRTIRGRLNRPPLLGPPTWWVRPGSAASQATPSFQRDRRAVLPPGVIANSTAVRFGREASWASGLGDDPERLADVEGDGRDPRWCLRPRRLGRADEPDVTALASELIGFHRKGQAESREGRAFPLQPPARMAIPALLPTRRLGRAGELGAASLASEPKGFHRKGHPKADGATSTLHAASSQKVAPPFVTVTLHPFFSGQTEKRGELRGRWRSAATLRPSGLLTRTENYPDFAGSAR